MALQSLALLAISTSCRQDVKRQNACEETWLNSDTHTARAKIFKTDRGDASL